MKALAAIPSAATALPALKPYHPTQSMPVPTIHNTRLCGAIGSFLNPIRGPRMRQRTNALHPLGNCANNQGRRNDSKHQLIHGIDVLRYPERVIRVRSRCNIRQKKEFVTAKERIAEILAEDQAVAADPPEHNDESGNPKTLGQDRQRVLSSDKASVEQSETRQGHKQDESSRGHLPRVVTGAGSSGQRILALAIGYVSLQVCQPIFNRSRRSRGGCWSR